jgi:hypothetical protein
VQLLLVALVLPSCGVLLLPLMMMQEAPGWLYTACCYRPWTLAG